jgi:hypothetical protein
VRLIYIFSRALCKDFNRALGGNKNPEDFLSPFIQAEQCEKKTRLPL